MAIPVSQRTSVYLLILQVSAARKAVSACGCFERRSHLGSHLPCAQHLDSSRGPPRAGERIRLTLQSAISCQHGTDEDGNVLRSIWKCGDKFDLRKGSDTDTNTRRKPMCPSCSGNDFFGSQGYSQRWLPAAGLSWINAH